MVLRLILYQQGTLELDFNTFVAWSNRINDVGFGRFYDSWSDYFPGYVYVLWLLGKINNLSLIDSTLLYKLPAILADLMTGYLIYKIVSKIKNVRWAQIASAAYIFNPAILANSTFWGQMDSVVALLSLSTIYLLTNKKLLVSAIVLGLGVSIKPQNAFVGVVALFYLFGKGVNFKEVIKYVGLSIAVFFLTFIPFSAGSSFIEFIITRISISYNQYPYTSINAFNFWGILGFWKSETILTRIISSIAVFGSISLGLKHTKKGKYRPFILLAIILFSVFLFFTRVHERHLLPVFAPLVIGATGFSFLWLVYSVLSLTYVANLYYSHLWISKDFFQAFSLPVVKMLSIVNVLLLVGIIFYSQRNNFEKLVMGIKKSFFVRKPTIKKLSDISRKSTKKILMLIILFSFITRIFQLGLPDKEYFDEVYHAFTAQRMLEGDPKAWEWWNEHPPGFAFEWTHPPLAKEMMVLGMSVFGNNPFGWRVPGAIFGTATIYLVFLISYELLRNRKAALLAAAIFSLDGLFLVMSRIGMNDVYFLFFALLSIYYLLKQRDFASAIAFGLSLASKWSALWVAPILLVIFISQKRKISLSILSFVILPPLIYLATYIPMFLTGHDLGTFIGVQKQMWWYHTGLEAEHAYTSSWWSWPFLARPIYLFTSDEIGGMVSRIYAMGNPTVFWVGIISVITSGVIAFVERNKKLGLVIFSYFAFFVPWALSPRIMFLYHYLPSIPFLSIALGYTLARYKKYMLPVLIIATISFIYFYPHYIGMNIPLTLDKSYYWFTSWR